MRVICLLFLLVIIAAVAIFVVQNNESIPIKYLQETFTVPLGLGAVAVYFLGMISGWTVVGMLRRSFDRVTESRR